MENGSEKKKSESIAEGPEGTPSTPKAKVPALKDKLKENAPPSMQEKNPGTVNFLLDKLKEDLFEAVKEAHILLNFATQKGMEIDQKTSNAIIQTKYSLASQALTGSKEVEFWKAYRHLAHLVHPVSIQSLKAIQLHAVGAVKFFQRSALIALVILLAAQILSVKLKLTLMK